MLPLKIAQNSDSMQYSQDRLNKLRLDLKKQKITDPFQSFSGTGQSFRQSVQTTSKSQEPSSPAYLLQGIVWDETNPKAILIKSKMYSDAGTMKIGETIIVIKNDTIDYGKVLDISENYVIITTYNNKFKLKSNLWEKTE